jgi:hypothetical protein
MDPNNLFKVAIDTMTPPPINTAIRLLSGGDKKENFSTKSSGNGSGVFAFFLLLVIITYIVAMIITWIRLVMKASTCSIFEGVAAFFFTSIYSMWKIGTLIGKDCNFTQTKQWF